MLQSYKPAPLTINLNPVVHTKNFGACKIEVVPKLFFVIINKIQTLNVFCYTFSMQNMFKDSNGKIVIAQKPNLPSIVWFVSYIASYLPLHDSLLAFFSLISFGALFTWAWLEIFSGVNLFRRLLGIVVMIVILIYRL